MSSNLTAIFEVTSIDGQSLSTSLSNDIILAAEASSQTFRIGNFKNGGTTYMSINSNVGIGTSNPLSILHINSINPYLKIQDSGNESSILAQLQFYTSTNSLEGFIGYSNNSNLLISNNNQSGSISFQTSNIDRITINETGNVGIGTYAEVPLHIYQDEPIIRLQDSVSTGSTTSHLQFYNVNNLEGYVGYTGSSNLIIANSNASGDINFKTSSSFGSTKMTIANNGEITSSGNIGIGTTPLTSLHIVANTAQIRLQDKNNLSSSISSFVEFFTSTISEGLLGYLGTADLNIINSNNSGSIIFKTANISRLLVDKDGLIQTSSNVGIGTTPLTPLHLYDSTPRIRMQDKDNTSGTIVSQLQFYSSGASEGQIGYEGTPDLYITNSNNASVIIKTAGLASLTISGSGINNVGTIQSTGNIGIGTTPSVNANIHISDNTPRIRLQDKDNLTGTITSLLQFYNANISEGSIGYIGTPDLIVTNSNTSGGIVLKTVNLQRFSIGNDGLIQSACNIGIGTSALTKLHIAALSPQIRLQDTNSLNSNNSKIEFYNLSNIDGFIGYDGSNNLNIVNSNVKGSIVLRNGSNVNLIIDKLGNINNSGIIQSAGNIGIGVSPSNSLHILDNNPQIRLQDKNSTIGTTTSQIQFYNSTSLEGLIGYEGSSNLNITNSNANGAFVFKSAGNIVYTIDSSGNVKNSGSVQNNGNIGIGTSALTNLHISATQPQIRIQDSDSSTGTTTSQIQFYNSSSLEGLIGYEGTSNLVISNSNSVGAIRIRTGGGACNLDRFIINSSGCIGIGTTNPTSILHINGTLNVKRIRIG